MRHWIIARLRENSTWRGIVWIMTWLGLSLRPDQAEAIIGFGMAVAGLLGVFTSDSPTPIHLESVPETLSEPEQEPVDNPQTYLLRNSAHRYSSGENTYPNFHAVNKE